MRAAAIEQFLKTISQLKSTRPEGASVEDVARETGLTEEQTRQAVQTLIRRGLVRMDDSSRLVLTSYGLRRLLTESIEDYLVTIYRLGRREEERVSTSAIAQALGVSAPSVTSMIQKKLAGLGLVDYERHRGVTLTPVGEQTALQVLRHHRIVELFLAETLGLPWDEVHDEANRLEHATSPMLIERMAAVLGDPLVDPHGDPIPRRNGTVAHSGSSSLYDSPLGQTVVVRRVRDQAPDVLRYLGEIGLFPGTAVDVLARGPLEGPLTVRIDGEEHVLGRSLASMILVSAPLET
jgi:DtxR family Mn-dependent transcriptional regulator